jgi:transitional endoplasmic reticulum ATPase
MSKNDIKSLEEALKKSPENLALRLMLALKLFKAKSYDDSEKHYLQVLRQDPDNSKAKQGLVELYFTRENYSATIVVGEELIKKNVAGEKVMELVAKSHLRQNNIKEAQELYERITKKNPFFMDDELEAVLEDKDEYEDENDDFFFEDDDEDEDYPFDGMPPNMFPFNPEDLLIHDLGANFQDVIGLEFLKDFMIMKTSVQNIEPIESTQIDYSAASKILLYGPSGCGKTHFVRSLPGELNVPLMPLPSEVIFNVLQGKGPGHLGFFFNFAGRKEQCVVFIDHIEIVSLDRGLSSYSSERRLSSVFLSDMDDIFGVTKDLLMVMSTNAPWLLDTSMLQSNRLDYAYFVAPPSLHERAEFFRMHVRTDDYDSEYLINHLAKSTQHYSYADLQSVFTKMMDSKMMDSMKNPEANPNITKSDIDYQISRHTPSTMFWFENFYKHVPEFYRKSHYFREVDEYCLANGLKF